MADAVSTDALLGRTVAGKFAVEAVIGAGAMGTVYRVRHLALERTVALKVLHPDLARDKGFVERFKREARAASRLDHPNSIRVLDFGEEGDSFLYIAMEYVDGRTLHHLIQEQLPLDDTRVVGLVSQVLAALAVAHDMGVIHRDLKPENIIVLRGTGDDGEAAELVKVCDFGIAKLMTIPHDEAGGPRATERGLIIGTPAYMSPEQARGEALDARADLYSVGIILYHLLAGRLPFEAETSLGLATKHVTETPPAPSTFAKVHPGLETVCLRAISKRKEERFQSAREMRAAVRAAVHGSRNTAAIEEQVQRATEMMWSRRRRVRAAWGIAAGMILALALGTTFFALKRGGSPVPVLASAAAPVVPAPPAPAPRDTPPQPPPAPAAVSEEDRLQQPRSQPARHRVSVAAQRKKANAAPRVHASGDDPAPVAEKSPAITVATNPAPPVTAPSLPPRPSVRQAPASAPLDLARASISITAVTTTSGIPGSNIRLALGRTPMLRCYRDALQAGGAVASGTAQLHLEIDVTGHVVAADLQQAQFLPPPSMKGCLELAAKQIRVKDVDTGGATAIATLSFSYLP
ncbi:MAG TPA: protein kinase [Polyangia bacterium]|jgi:serine/threonine-protein kinase|nr:protein kinase [Polyangia bacterium]